MSDNRKIATCSYCGTRAVLILDKSRHELSCSACGAPLHDMKFMPQHPGKKSKDKPKKSPKAKYQPGQHDRYDPSAQSGGYRKKKTKKRKPLFGRIIEELWDEVEDLFD